MRGGSCLAGCTTADSLLLGSHQAVTHTIGYEVRVVSEAMGGGSSCSN